MKKAFRIPALVLCLIITLSCFTACTDDTTADPNESDPVNEEVTDPVVIELGAVIDKVYTIVEIDRDAGTCIALLLEDENSYKNETYKQGRQYDINTHELLAEITYTRGTANRLMKVVYNDPKNNDILKTEEYAYSADGQMLSSVSRNEKGMITDSVSYNYNADGSYTVTTIKETKVVSITEFDRMNNVIARTDYEYKDNGAYTKRSYADGRMMQYVTCNAEGNEETRAVYTYNADGTYTVALYENGLLQNQQTGTAEDIVTQPPETTTQERETLDSNAQVTIPPTTEPTTNNNDPTTATRPSTQTTTQPTTQPSTRPTTTEPVTDASGSIDMLAQSRIFRSGEYCLVGSMENGNEIMYMTVAITGSTMYTSMEVDFGQMMGTGSTGMTELGFLQTADGTTYMLETKTKTYCSMAEASALFGEEGADVEDLFGDLDMSEAFIAVSQYAQPDKTENKTLNGESVTCYTFNVATGESVKHYVNSNGQLVRVEDYNASGNIIQMFDVENLSGNFAEYMKKIPSDFTKTDLMTMLLGMMGDYGTVIE